MTRAHAENILARFTGRRILVVGDLMVDEYIWGQVSRVSPEAPVLVLDAARETFVPGGAANVANQLLSLGAQVTVAGAVGQDAVGEKLIAHLQEMGADTSCVVACGDRPTTQKTRIVAGTQQMVRVDREIRSPLPARESSKLVAQVANALDMGGEAIVFSDYDKGVLHAATVAPLISRARERETVITANPKPATAKLYAGIDIAQLNRSEADAASLSHNFDSSDDATFHQAGAKLRAALRVRNLLVTRGAQGLTVFHENGTFNDVPAHRVDVFDPAGAGDSTIAGYTLALASGATLSEAIEIGNAAGGAVVRKVGVVTATREEIAALFSPND